MLYEILPYIPNGIMAIIGVIITLRPVKSDKWKWGIIGIFFILVIATIWINAQIDQNNELKQDKRFSDLKIDYTSKLNDFKQTMMAINNSNNSTEEKVEMLVQSYREFTGTTEKEAEKWVEELVESTPQKLKKLETLRQKEKELGEDLTKRYAPFIIRTLEEFDERIITLQREGEVDIKLESRNPNMNEYIEYYSFGIRGDTLRTAIFPNGTHLSIVFSPGAISEGQLSRILKLTFDDNYTHSGNFDIRFTKDKSSINGNEIRYSTNSPPMDDEELFIKTKKAIFFFIEQAYYNDLVRK